MVAGLSNRLDGSKTAFIRKYHLLGPAGVKSGNNPEDEKVEEGEPRVADGYLNEGFVP